MPTTFTTSFPDLLMRAGVLLYGEHWARKMSEDIDVGERTIRRWVSGKAPIPDGVWEEISMLLERRSVEASVLASEIEEVKNFV